MFLNLLYMTKIQSNSWTDKHKLTQELCEPVFRVPATFEFRGCGGVGQVGLLGLRQRDNVVDLIAY